jgi:hypothetical protein
MDELELLRRSRPDPAPSPDTTARHRRALADAIEMAADESTYVTTDGTRRGTRIAAIAAALVVVAGIGAGTLTRSGEDTTRVVTAEPVTTSTSTSARSGIVPCGSRLPSAISDGPREHNSDEMDPATVSVRIYACRLERSLPDTLTGPDGHTRQLVTTLRELMDRFGGLEGSVMDEFGRAHPISLAPLADADPDTTAVGLIWSGRRRDAPPVPPDRPMAPPTSLNLDPPWLEPRRP